ncbi:MAG: sodium:proton antiporter NhaD [Brevinematales bacterium]|jgi:Na+/H+ antiporter NhaD/arsenite permease-like protein
MNMIIVIVFLTGYSLIIFEKMLKINKAAFSLLTGVFCWLFLIINRGIYSGVLEKLNTGLSDTAGILFFLLGAMTIVELIESHHGFDIIIKRISAKTSRQLLWAMALITFFLSAVLDNLTTAIIMTMLMRKLVSNTENRMIFSGIIIIAANAGGAWSPIGDVTTTMLWIGERITALNTASRLIVPCIINLLIPLILSTLMLHNTGIISSLTENSQTDIHPVERNIIFFSGVGVLISVPVFKILTHMPPYMGILAGLGLLWVLTELMHKNKEDDMKHSLSVLQALKNTDMSAILFFFGILLSVSALETAGILSKLATWASSTFQSVTILTAATGLLSAIIDNVPLVAASIGMYPVSIFPTDHYFWELIAYCTGTGGSILIIGSAAGVAVMGIGKVEFFRYVKKISWLAILGYISGIGVFSFQNYLFNH